MLAMLITGTSIYNDAPPGGIREVFHKTEHHYTGILLGS